MRAMKNKQDDKLSVLADWALSVSAVCLTGMPV